MNRSEYIAQLTAALRGKLAFDEIEDIVRDYQEFFDEGVRQGKSEEQVIQEGIEHFKSFLGSIGVPQTLHEENIDKEDLPFIVEGVVKVSFGQDGMLKCIPPVSREDIMEVLKIAF